MEERLQDTLWIWSRHMPAIEEHHAPLGCSCRVDHVTEIPLFFEVHRDSHLAQVFLQVLLDRLSQSFVKYHRTVENQTPGFVPCETCQNNLGHLRRVRHLADLSVVAR